MDASLLEMCPFFKMKYLLVFIACFTISESYSQFQYRGKVVDALTQEGIYGVHVYSTSVEKLGTITNADGLFVLNSNRSIDTLLFSHVGYENESILSKDLKKSIHIGLVKSVASLDEVIVSSKEITGADVIQMVFDQLKSNHKIEPVFYEFYNRIAHVNIKDSVLHFMEEYSGFLYQNSSSDTRYKIGKARSGSFSDLGKKTLPKQRLIAGDMLKIDNVFKFREDYLSPKKSKHYVYDIKDRVLINNRYCYVISFSTSRNTAYKEGLLYIDMEDYAIAKHILSGKNKVKYEVSFFKANNGKWYLKNAMQWFGYHEGKRTNHRITLYNPIYNAEGMNRSDFINWTPNQYVREVVGSFSEEYWENTNFIPLPSWINSQIENSK